MQCFTDSKNLKWTIALDVATARRIKAELSIDLVQPTQDLMTRLADDVALIVDLLEILTRSQRQARKLHEDYCRSHDPPLDVPTDSSQQEEFSILEFCRRLTGDTLEPASQALIEELLLFCHPHRRQAMQTAWQRIQEVQKRTSETAVQLLQSPEMDQRITRELEQIQAEMLGTFSTNGAASPGSTPTVPA